MVFAAIAAGLAVAVVSLAFYVTPLDGTSGWVICSYLVFVALYWALTRRSVGPLRANDRAATVVLGTLGLGVVVPLCFIIGYVTLKGIHGLNQTFFTDTMEKVGPLDPSSAGGARHAILGTLIQVGLATLISVPLGVLSAVYLNEVGGRMAKTVRFLVDSMSGVPSIVAGLFIYTIWVVQLGKGFSGLSAAFALSILMLPTVTRTAEEMLKLVPGGLRESSLALGASEWRTVWRVVLPTREDRAGHRGDPRRRPRRRRDRAAAHDRVRQRLGEHEPDSGRCPPSRSSSTSRSARRKRTRSLERGPARCPDPAGAVPVRDRPGHRCPRKEGLT